MRKHGILIILWLVSDAGVFMGAYSLAYFLRVGWILSTDFPFEQFLVATSLTVPLWLGILIGTRRFTLLRRQGSIENVLQIGYASLVGTAFFTLIYYFQFSQFFSRLLLVEACVLTWGSTWGWHMCFERLSRSLLTKHPPCFPTAIIGMTRESAALIRILKHQKCPLSPVAILDSRGTKEKNIEGVPIQGKLNVLEETLEREHITHLIQCSDMEQSINLLSACRARGITYIVLPSVFGIVERDERTESIEGLTATVIRPRLPWWTSFFA